MDELKKYLKTQAWLVIATLVICGVFLFFFLPKFREYKQITKDIKTQDQKITILTEKLNDLNALSEKEVQDNADLALRAVPAEKDFYLVVKNIKNIFNQEGVSLPEFRFDVGMVSTDSAQSSSGEAGQQEFFTISLSFLGSMEKVEKVISRLENSLPLLAIDFFELVSESSSASGILGDYTGEMKLKSFFAPLPKTLAAVDKELPKVDSQQKKLLEGLSSFEYPASEELPLEGIVVGRENPFSAY